VSQQESLDSNFSVQDTALRMLISAHVEVTGIALSWSKSLSRLPHVDSDTHTGVSPIQPVNGSPGKTRQVPRHIARALPTEPTLSSVPQPVVALTIGPDLESRPWMQWDCKPSKQPLFYAVLPLLPHWWGGPGLGSGWLLQQLIPVGWSGS